MSYDLIEIDFSGPPGRALLTSLTERHGPALAALAKAVERPFLIRSDWAPGLRFAGARTAGGTIPPLSLSGAGLTLEDALASCLGEGAERLAQIERPGAIARRCPLAACRDSVPSAVARAVAEAVGAEPQTPLDWVAGRDAASGREVLLPADWCLRRSEQLRRLPRISALSSGVAAGACREAAAERALLEIVERDAAALWWLGGRPATVVGVDELTETAAAIARVRDGNTARQTIVLDLTTDLGVPVAAAVSTDVAGGALAIGLGCRRTLDAAARAAVMELGQMEIGLLIAQGKIASGGPLTGSDRDHLARAALTLEDLPTTADRARPGAAEGGFDELLAGLTTEIAFIDHAPCDDAIAVVQAIALDLQPMPAMIVTPRLARYRIGPAPGRLPPLMA